MMNLTKRVEEKLNENGELKAIVIHIYRCCCSSEIINDPMLADFQIWQVKDKELFCQADTDTEKLFSKKISSENIKMYCCPNGENGYTLMLPEEY
jgi:hypothetical protein